MIHNHTARRAIFAFLSTRCDVSSQHKLPTEDELLNTTVAEFIGRGRMKAMLDGMVRNGSVLRYGPYLSDHEIDVL